MYALKQIINAISQANEAQQRVKSFKCRKNLDFRTVEVDKLMREILALIQSEATEAQITLNYRPSLHLPNVTVDPFYIEKALLKILRYSIDILKNDTVKYPRIVIETDLSHDNHLIIMIIDNGPGYVLNVINSQLDSINSNQVRLGFDVARSRTIIESHGGKLTILSPSQGGCCFKISLPITPINKN